MTPEAEPEVVLAVDVARFGSDRSVILRRRGEQVEEIRTFQGLDTMQLTGWVISTINKSQPSRICVDEIGVGAEVVDRLKEQGYRVVGINVARRAGQEALFANLRAEAIGACVSYSLPTAFRSQRTINSWASWRPCFTAMTVWVGS